MGIHKYFRSLNELERIIRCPGKFKFEEHSVAAHSQGRAVRQNP